MPKVHVQQRLPSPPRRSVRFCPSSLVYTVGYVVNLALIPFKAYMSEPFPWQLQSLSSFNLNLDAPFDIFANTTVTYFASKYNQDTVKQGIVFTKDTDGNSYLLRFSQALPPASDTQCVHYMCYFPGTEPSDRAALKPAGAVFYSQGMAAFVCDYVAQNASNRLTGQTSFECQQATFLGLRVAATCTWIVMSPFDTNNYDIYHAVQLLEAPVTSWVKFGLRCGLFGYIARTVWQLYYRHYGPLLHNLRTLGLQKSTDSCGYKVLLGDPTWLILSHPFVSLFMLVDCFVNASYAGAANSRTSQVSDIGEFCLGCLYGSRTVWAAYTLMRYATPLIHQKAWEKYFQPVDPGLLALTSSFYSGPLMYLFSRTRIVLAYQWLQSSLVPQAKRLHSVESFPLMVTLLITMATLPMAHSFVTHAIRNHRIGHATSTFATRTPDKFASRHFNDWKHWLLILRWPRGHDGATKEGGTLYHLFDTNPRYRNFPLFSTRGSDCFVYCVDADTGSIVHQVRLSLIYALNRQTTCPTLAIPICPSDHPTCAVGNLDGYVCGPSKQSPPSVKCLHLGANACQWIY
ncbi:Aste57867_2215 [Aphanomyces stellatus]|uniref:Aste57867_2215 protein n=1 Tax=Aphanomyces stellatus TaxID=120398 RepID=A0A485K6Z0_9STRA|nr:hypothetical protein As57867_002210 [Aphanomyces stellatus]VFT79418.1 Aste57867_2215 [Aphanomyces stellatus]